MGGYPVETLAEDMDLTWTLYRKNIGRVLFVADAMAYTDDPKTFKQMKAQLSRWSCAYYENIRKHYIGLWRTNKRAWGFVTVGLVDSITGTFWYPILAVVAFFRPLWAAGAFFLDIGFLAAVTSVGAYRQRMVRRMLSFMPHFVMLRITNTFFYMKYLVLTGILGRSIGTYVKGH